MLAPSCERSAAQLAGGGGLTVCATTIGAFTTDEEHAVCGGGELVGHAGRSATAAAAAGPSGEMCALSTLPTICATTAFGSCCGGGGDLLGGMLCATSTPGTAAEGNVQATGQDMRRVRVPMAAQLRTAAVSVRSMKLGGVPSAPVEFRGSRSSVGGVIWPYCARRAGCGHRSKACGPRLG